MINTTLNRPLSTAQSGSTVIQEKPPTSEVSQLFKLSWKNRLMQATLAAGSNYLPAATAELAYHLWSRPRRRKLKQTPLLQRGESFKVYHNGHFLHARRWGNENGGPKAVLVHGWESEMGRMLPFVQPLLDRGWQVIALDGPAHGRSGQMRTNVVDFGAGLRSLLLEIRGADAIIAHSYGAAAALFTLEKHRHLVPQRIVCLAPMVHMGIHLSIFKTLTSISAEVAARLRLKIESRLSVRCEDWQILDIPKRLDLPGLILHDTTDQVVAPEWGDQLHQRWPGSTLISTTGLGHNRILRDPAVIQHAVSFCDV